MATLRIDSNDTYVTEVTIVESDKHTQSTFMRFNRINLPGEIRACNEMMLTPNQLENLGRFLIRQASEIRTAQDVRHSESSL